MGVCNSDRAISANQPIGGAQPQRPLRAGDCFRVRPEERKDVAQERVRKSEIRVQLQSMA